MYDMFMDNVPYEVWGRYIVEKLRANGIDSGYVVDLGLSLIHILLTILSALKLHTRIRTDM